MRTLGMGIHDGIPEGVYHADPCERPSLSYSIAHLLVSKTPLHAWTQHPRLNPDYQPTDTDATDIGSGAHALLLEGRDPFEVLDHPDWRNADGRVEWRKADAKEAVKAARAAGRIPIKPHDYEPIIDMVSAVNAQLDGHTARPRPFTDGKPERTLIWEEDGVVCRARVDWLHDDLAYVDDLKTTSSASLRSFERAIIDHGYDVQVAFYLRGIEHLTGVRPSWRWVVVEKTPPYALRVIEPSPYLLELGAAKVARAIETWARCLADDVWPAYPAVIAVAEPPPWAEADWLAGEVAA